MADKEKKKDRGEGTKTDRRRLAYLKIRAQELKKEQQANKEESNALRAKLGMSGKKGKKGGDGDDED